MTRDELLARLNAPPPLPLEGVADFLRSAVCNAIGEDEIEDSLRRRAAHNPRLLAHWAGAIEALLVDPPPPGTLARMVAVDGNLGLPDETDAGAIPWLRDMAERIKRIRTEAAEASSPGG